MRSGLNLIGRRLESQSHIAADELVEVAPLARSGVFLIHQRKPLLILSTGAAAARWLSSALLSPPLDLIMVNCDV